MGRSHALSGAVVWLGACAAWQAAAPDPGPSGTVVTVGAATAAGYALLPDIDHPRSTIARALGPVTGALSWLATRGAAALRDAGCAHCAGGPRRGGHRAVTHTFVFAAALGLVLAVLGGYYGTRAGLPVVAVGVWLATYPALSSRTRAEVGDMILPGKVRRLGRTGFRFAAVIGSLLLALLLVGSMATLVPAEASWWWAGLAAGVGTFTHSLGDSLTRSGSPLWWPLRIAGCRWRSVGSPRAIRFTTGGKGEWVAVGLLLVAGAGSLWALVG